MKDQLKQIELEQTAREIAASCHAGQKYDKKFDYMVHVNGVVNNTLRLFGYSSDRVIVALLHDVLEDSDETEEDLSQYFSEDIVNAVAILTKKSYQTYEDYIDLCLSNQLAREVKIADTLFNLEYSIFKDDKKRISKYSKQFKLLTNGEIDD